MQSFPPFLDLLSRLKDADLDPDLAQRSRRDGSAVSTLKVAHLNRQVGRGRHPSHSLVMTIHDGEITLTTSIHEPRPGDTSLEHTATLTSRDADELTTALDAWYEAVKAAERATFVEQPVSPTTAPRATQTSAPLVTDPFTPNDPVDAPRRPTQVDMGVYIVHTPPEHPDVPAGSRGHIVENGEGSRVLVEIDSQLFNLGTTRWIDVEHLVLIDDPGVVLIAA